MEEKVTVVIPNFNGRDLLAKNLPKVAQVCPNCQIIVVDDASGDDSVDFLKKNFKEIKIIENKKNLGFARSANIGAQAATGDFILFLNTDVSPQPNFLKMALVHFASKQSFSTNKQSFSTNKNSKSLFAVGMADQSHGKGKIITRGRGGAKFKKGFLNHFAASPESGETLWVSGGSGLFDKGKFHQLGGFDSVFAPFYWEDIDLCWRARKSGLICLFDSGAKVDHYHEEGAIKKTHSPLYIKTVAYKNQFLFVWKNISDYLMISQHLLWLPYHFAKALVTLDRAFFLGFLWALFQIPQLIGNWKFEIGNLKLTDREVLSNFEKP